MFQSKIARQTDKKKDTTSESVIENTKWTTSSGKIWLGVHRKMSYGGERRTGLGSKERRASRK